MDGSRFDRWTESLSAGSPRRGVLRVLTGAALSLSGASIPGEVGARSKRKRKKLNRNQFGCVNVGGRCRGKDHVCCSGICQGKKPKKGEHDHSRCKAHDVGVLENGGGGCRAQDESLSGDVYCTTSAGEENGLCWRTTGNAGHCGLGSVCVPCRKDTDCVAACGAGAACAVNPNACGGTGVFCSGTTLCDEP